MKTGSFLIAILILTLVSMPCTDQPDTSVDEATYTTSTAHHEMDHDLCSPFCTCHCCHTYITRNSPLYLNEMVTFSGHSVTSKNHLLECIAFAIWDPPQLMS